MFFASIVCMGKSIRIKKGYGVVFDMTMPVLSSNHLNKDMLGLRINSKQANDVKTTSYRRQCDVMTSH